MNALGTPGHRLLIKKCFCGRPGTLKQRRSSVLVQISFTFPLTVGEKAVIIVAILQQFYSMAAGKSPNGILAGLEDPEKVIPLAGPEMHANDTVNHR